MKKRLFIALLWPLVSQAAPDELPAPVRAAGGTITV